MLRFAEEIILLLLDEERGELAPNLPPHSLHIVLVGAVLMDLALEGRIDTDLKQLILADSTPLADDLLDPTLAAIAGSSQVRDARFWIAHEAQRGDDIRDKALARLTQRGILESESEGFFFFSRLVSRARRYPMLEGKTAEDVRLRVMRVLFSDDIPDPRDIVLICLADACGLFERILSKSERAEVQERLELVQKLDLLGQSVTEAIREVESSTPVAPSPHPRKEIPQASGWPLLGNAFSMSEKFHDFLLEQYYTLGPVFRIRAFHHRFIVLAGPEANIFAGRGNHYFRNREDWQAFSSYFGANRTLIGMDGPEHIRMRKEQASLHTHKLIENRLAEAIDIVRRDIAEWPSDRPIQGQYVCQRIITEQLLSLSASTSAKEYLDDIILFFDAMMMHYLARKHPRVMLYRPRVRRARRRVLELARTILADHQPENRRDHPPDYIDELLELNRTDPYFMPESDLLLASMGPMFTALDTAASTCAFMLYALLKHPELREQMASEINPFFASQTPTLRDLRRLDVTHRIAMETMRLWPLAPAIRRTVANSFEFAGYTVAAGEQVLVAMTLPHLMPEYFPNPDRFDIERYTPQRAEHRQRGVYAPFGVGAHQCLGRSLAEALLAINLGIIVRETELALHPPDYTLKIRPLPVAHPNPSFKFRLLRRRPAGNV